MDTSRLDKMVFFLNHYEKESDTYYERYEVREEIEKIISTISIEDIINYLKDKDNDTAFIFFMLDKRLHKRRYLPLAIEQFKNDFDKLQVVINNIFFLREGTLDDSVVTELKEKVGEDKLHFFYSYLPEHEKTEELFKKYVDYLIEKNGENRDLSNTNQQQVKRSEELSIEKIDIIKESLKKNNSIKNRQDLAFFIAVIWNNTQNQSADILKYLINYYKEFNFDENAKDDLHDDLDYDVLLHYTNPENKDCIKVLIEDYFYGQSQEELDKKMSKLLKLLGFNKDILKTISLCCLDDRFDFLDIEQQIRIFSANDVFMSPEGIRLGSFLGNCLQDEVWGKIIRNITADKEGTFEKIYTIGQSYIFYKDSNAFNEIKNMYNSKGKIDEELECIINKLTDIMLKDPANMFFINSIDDINNYDKKRREICLSILKDNESSFGKVRIRLSEDNKKKFALLELLYGISFYNARNLTKKYGKSIEKIHTKTPEEESIKRYIQSLKTIMELDNSVIDKMVKDIDFMTFLQNSEVPQIASSFILHKHISEMFKREFDEKIEQSSEPRKETLNFNNKEIEIQIYSPVDKEGNFRYTEFATLVRQEGIHGHWIRPKSFNDYFNVQSLLTHGNSESFITQSQIVIANGFGGPKVAYNKLGSLLMVSPWNIISANANSSISPVNVEWYNTGNGIEYRTPDELINYMRCFLNEIVSDRIIKIMDDGVIKRNPTSSLFILDRLNEDRNNLKGMRKDEWLEDLCLAYEMGLPIIIIDREGFAIQEEMVIQHDLELLGGKTAEGLSSISDLEQLTGKKCEIVDWSNKSNLSHEELIREIIVRFENNAIGMQYSNFKDKYFTDEKRNSVINTLMSIIESEKITNPLQYYKDLELIESIINEEKQKESTNLGIKFYQVPKAYMHLEKRINDILTHDGKRDNFFKVDNKDEFEKIIDYIYNSEMYDENKLHSTGHVVRTTLFADILAKHEGLSEREKSLVLIASALHDNSIRLGDEKKSHAVLSAEKAGEILSDKNTIFGGYNLTEKEIKLIQIAIEYHEDSESEDRIKSYRNDFIQDNYFCFLFYLKYGLKDEKDIQTAIRLSKILRDADALEDERFSAYYSTTNIALLNTKSAKDIRMLTFADRLNNQIANIMLGKYYDQATDSINGVRELKDRRFENFSCEKQELTKEEMIDAIIKMGVEFYDCRNLLLLRSQYEAIGIDDVNSAINKLKDEFDLLSQKSTFSDEGVEINE